MWSVVLFCDIFAVMWTENVDRVDKRGRSSIGQSESFLNSRLPVRVRPVPPDTLRSPWMLFPTSRDASEFDLFQYQFVQFQHVNH